MVEELRTSNTFAMNMSLTDGGGLGFSRKYIWENKSPGIRDGKSGGSWAVKG